MNSTATSPATKPTITPKAPAKAPMLLFDPALSLENLVPSKTQPRQVFDEAYLNELAESIKVSGIIHPILARPLINEPGKFEIVAGECRVRASKIAGNATIPATFQALDDLGVVKAQLIENEHRKDINPLEEAIGFRNLMAMTNPATGKPHTKEDVAKQIGMSVRHVFNRLSLLKLCPDVRTALLNGTLEQSKALQIATIGNPENQIIALKHITAPISATHPESISAREAAIYIRHHFNTAFTNAMFDLSVFDYKNSIGQVIAGACDACPKNGNKSPELFADAAAANVCMDVVCFQAKNGAANVIKIANFQRAGKQVITGERARQIFPYSTDDSMSQQYVDPAMQVFNQLPAKLRGQTYREMLGDKLPTVLVESPNSKKLIELVDVDAANRLLVAGGVLSKIVTKREPTPEQLKASAAPVIQPLIKPATATQPQLPAVPYEPETDPIHDARQAAYKAARKDLATGLAHDDWRDLLKLSLLQLDAYGDSVNLDWLIDLHLTAADKGDSPIDRLMRFAQIIPFDGIPRFLFDIALAQVLSTDMGPAFEFDALDDLLERYQQPATRHVPTKKPTPAPATIKPDAKPAAKAKQAPKAATKAKLAPKGKAAPKIAKMAGK